MSSKKQNQVLCALCHLVVEEGPLLQHYLQDEALLTDLGRQHPGWDRSQPVCAKCLEHHKQEMDSIYSHVSHVSQVGSEAEFSGEQTVVTHQEEAVPEVAGDQVPCLLVIHGSNFAKRYDLIKREVIIGRSDSADVSVNEENVSRQHAKILVGPKEIVIKDLDSTNGTFVNTERIPSKTLKDGDLILIGNTILKFISGSNVESLYHKEIYKLATLDGLTQVYNKAYIIERLGEEFRRSRRYGRDLSLVMFDFDRFKLINDQYGHQAGDYILKHTSSLIMKNMRKDDIFGRYGGEEFTIIFLETPLAIAAKISDKFRKLVEVEPFIFDKKKIKVTISVGVAAMNKQIKTYKDLMKLADEALYRAKHEGRNRVCTA